MALNARTAEGGNTKIELLERGTYPVRLASAIDMGLQPRSYKGEDKTPHQEMMVTYEFLDEFLKDEDGSEMPDKPRWQSETFYLFNLDNDKAKATMRYRAIDPELKHGGEWADLIGEPAMLTIIHNTKGEKTYANVGGLSQPRAKDVEKWGPLVNKGRVFNLDEPDMDVFKSLPQWVQDKISSNLNFKGSKLEAHLGTTPLPQTEEGTDDSPY